MASASPLRKGGANVYTSLYEAAYRIAKRLESFFRQETDLPYKPPGIDYSYLRDVGPGLFSVYVSDRNPQRMFAIRCRERHDETRLSPEAPEYHTRSGEFCAASILLGTDVYAEAAPHLSDAVETGLLFIDLLFSSFHASNSFIRWRIIASQHFSLGAVLIAGYTLAWTVSASVTCAVRAVEPQIAHGFRGSVKSATGPPQLLQVHAWAD